MGSFLEISKIAIATYLHDQWKQTYRGLKIYLTISLIVLSFITSLGIYGLLTTGFQENISKMTINDKQILNIKTKQKRFGEVKNELTIEKNNLNKDISQLRNALSNNTTTQSVDKKTGQITTKANTGNRKAFESQLKEAQTRKDNISLKIDALNDSITSLDIQILNIESKSELGNELGVVKYISEITQKPVKQIANIFILLIVFVFDPLAIILVITANHAFKSSRPSITPSPSEPILEQNNEAEQIEKEIEKIQKSGAIGRRIESAISPLINRLKSLKKDNDNQIEY